jgi:hypothetical protein
LALVVLAGLILALVTRRPLGTLLKMRFRRVQLLWLGAALHLLFIPPVLIPILSSSTLPGLPKLGGVIYVVSLCILLAFAWLNRSNPGIAVIGLGLLMNTAVIAANGGRMPVDSGQLESKGALERMAAAEASGTWTQYVVAGNGTRLGLLGDWLSLPRPVLGPVTASPGDLVIDAGALLFLLVIPGGRPGNARAYRLGGADK